MNIDETKFEKEINSGWTRYDLLKLLTDCEVDFIDCNECGNKNITCHACKHRKDAPDMFKPKQNELDKLFIGAPVMVKDLSGQKSVLKSFHYKTIHNYYTELGSPCAWNYCRLPTVEEAPRNVWLAPWFEMPKELMELKVLLWAKNGDIGFYGKGRCDPNVIAWNNVIKLQIIEE